MQRPIGVTILAVLYFIATCGLVLFGIAILVGGGFLSRMLAQNPDIGEGGAAMLAGAGVFIAVCVFAFAVLFGFLGYGMLNLRNWARTIAIVLAIIGAAFAALGVIWGILRIAPFRLITSGIRLGINILIIWYLNQPHVKAAFAAGVLPASGMPGGAGISR